MAWARALGRPPVLIVFSGLPGTGKSTIARALAVELRAAYLRIDTIETAIGRAEGSTACNSWHAPPGYEVGVDLATDQLRLGLDVVADAVNPLRASRDRWHEAGLEAGARVVEVETRCSDVAEHRRRAEDRVLDVPGLVKPTWQQIVDREYEPWDREPLLLDTAVVGVEAAVRMISEATTAWHA